jgi:uncharacterized membrane protein YeaQ/YmgE (transglycosylase-associated protein family)
VEIVLIALAAVVVLFLIALLVVGLVFKLLWWALAGLVLGVIARAILPGQQQIGVLATAGCGVAAAFLGGVIGHIVGFGSFLQFVIAVIAAVVIVGAVSAGRPARA